MIEITLHRDAKGEAMPKSFFVNVFEARKLLLEKLSEGAQYVSKLPPRLVICGKEDDVWVTTSFSAVSADFDDMRVIHVAHNNQKCVNPCDDVIGDVLQAYDVTDDSEVAAAHGMQAEDLYAALLLAKEIRSRHAYLECRETLQSGIWCGDEERRQLSLFAIAQKHGLVAPEVVS